MREKAVFIFHEKADGMAPSTTSKTARRTLQSVELLRMFGQGRLSTSHVLSLPLENFPPTKRHPNLFTSFCPAPSLLKRSVSPPPTSSCILSHSEGTFIPLVSGGITASVGGGGTSLEGEVSGGNRRTINFNGRRIH